MSDMAPYLEKLFALHARVGDRELMNRAWITYLVDRLPEDEREAAVDAIVAGTAPMAYEAARGTKPPGAA